MTSAIYQYEYLVRHYNGCLLHITSFKPHNGCYESYFTDEKAEAQKVKYVCDIINLVSGIATLHSTNGE